MRRRRGAPDPIVVVPSVVVAQPGDWLVVNIGMLEASVTHTVVERLSDALRRIEEEAGVKVVVFAGCESVEIEKSG